MSQELAKELINKISITNFIRYFGPGIISLGIIGVSTTTACSDVFKKLIENKKEIIVGALFLTVGLLLHQMYRAFFYNHVIGILKDRKHCRFRSWKNYRELIREKHLAKGYGKVKSGHAEWIWRQVKREIAPDGYTGTMEFWAASIHLLYFSGISMMGFSIFEFIATGGTLGWFYLLGGGIVFFSGYLSDNEYERAETYQYFPDDTKLETQLEEIVKHPAYKQ